ncbi:MAG TPA: threonine ammonia-lyase [Gemmatimonadaceae bacterium]|nr:threonine ammonia-lyase [Gemmatimonadaceae bacterium]
MSASAECCGWTTWCEMAGMDEDGRPLGGGMPGLADIREARERIRDGVVATPLVPALALRERLPCALHLKLESTQRTGSFKDRGALRRLLDLTPEERRRGVVTASAGNHAQAVAYHGARLGIPVEVVMPEHTPLIKVANTRRFGAGVRFHGATLSDAMTEARRLEAEERRVLVHAFDDERVIAGQGTIGLELLEQMPALTAVVVPIGGGGLISGIAVAIKEQQPEVRIFGVEAAAAPSALASRRAGRIVPIETTETIADGIAVKRVGERTFPIIERYVDDIVAVDEVEIAGAVHLLLEHQKLLAEGAGAAPLAALLAGRLPLRASDAAAMVLSGGNIDVNLVERIVDRGLVADGRLARVAVTVHDRPGHLARLTQLVAAEGANVLEVSHRRAFADISVRDVEIVMHLETRGRDHMDAVIARLEREGFAVSEDS